MYINPFRLFLLLSRPRYVECYRFAIVRQSRWIQIRYLVSLIEFAPLEKYLVWYCCITQMHRDLPNPIFF